MLALVVLGRRLLVEEGILGQVLLKVHGVDGRLGRSTATDRRRSSYVLWDMHLYYVYFLCSIGLLPSGFSRRRNLSR